MWCDDGGGDDDGTGTDVFLYLKILELYCKVLTQFIFRQLIWWFEPVWSYDWRLLNSFDVDFLLEFFKFSMEVEGACRKDWTELVSKGIGNNWGCSEEDWDFRSLRANCALRLDRSDNDYNGVLLACEILATELHFFRYSKHWWTSEDSIFLRESRASRMQTCLMSKSSRKELIDLARSDASSGIRSWEKEAGSEKMFLLLDDVPMANES